MQRELLQRLSARFGSPQSETTKMYRWYLGDNLQFALQRDTGAAHTVLWIPWNTDQEPALNGEIVSAGEPRHEHLTTAHTPRLSRGECVLRLQIDSAPQIDLAAKYLEQEAMRQGLLAPKRMLLRDAWVPVVVIALILLCRYAGPSANEFRPAWLSAPLVAIATASLVTICALWMLLRERTPLFAATVFGVIILAVLFSYGELQTSVGPELSDWLLLTVPVCWLVVLGFCIFYWFKVHEKDTAFLLRTKYLPTLIGVVFGVTLLSNYASRVLINYGLFDIARKFLPETGTFSESAQHLLDTWPRIQLPLFYACLVGSTAISVFAYNTEIFSTLRRWSDERRSRYRKMIADWLMRVQGTERRDREAHYQVVDQLVRSGVHTTAALWTIVLAVRAFPQILIAGLVEILLTLLANTIASWHIFWSVVGGLPTVAIVSAIMLLAMESVLSSVLGASSIWQWSGLILVITVLLSMLYLSVVAEIHAERVHSAASAGTIASPQEADDSRPLYALRALVIVFVCLPLSIGCAVILASVIDEQQWFEYGLNGPLVSSQLWTAALTVGAVVFITLGIALVSTLARLLKVNAFSRFKGEMHWDAIGDALLEVKTWGEKASAGVSNTINYLRGLARSSPSAYSDESVVQTRGEPKSSSSSEASDKRD